MYMETIAKKLKEARKNKGYTQKQVTNITGIEQENISKYENGKTEPSIENLGKLADQYGISIDWLYGRSEKIYIS